MQPDRLAGAQGAGRLWKRLPDASASAGVATPMLLTQSLLKTGGQEIIAFHQPFTCLREGLGGVSHGNFACYAYNKAQTNCASVMETMYYLFFFHFLEISHFVCYFFFFPRWAVSSSTNPDLFPRSDSFCWEKQQNFKM